MRIHKKLMSNQKGLTLVELIIAIGLLSAIIAAISAFYIAGSKGFAREISTVDNQRNVRRATNEIGREIRRAKEADVVSGKLRLSYSDGAVIEYYLDGDAIKEAFYRINHVGNLVLDKTSEIVNGMKKFEVTIISDKINIKIESIENANNNTFKQESEFVLRK